MTLFSHTAQWGMVKQHPFINAVRAQGVGAAFTAVVSFSLTLLLARHMEPHLFGSFLTWLNLGTLTLIAIEGGWPTVVYRRFAQSGLQHLPHVLLTDGLRHVVYATVLAMTLALILLPQETLVLASALAACMGAAAAMNLASAHMRGIGEFALEARWQSTGRAVSALFILVAASLLPDLTPTWVFAAWAIGLLFVLTTWGRRWLPRLQLGGLRQQAWSFEAWPFVPVALAGMWLLKGDLLLLQGSAASAALYAACTRLTEGGLLLFAPVGNVVLGKFSALAASASTKDSRHAHKLARKLCLFAMVAGGVVVAGSALWGTFLMDLLFGEAYANAGTLLPWVVAMLPFAWCNMVLVQLAIAQNQERLLLACLLVCGSLLAIGVPLLSTQHGNWGAALTVMLCQAVLMLMLVVVTRAGLQTQTAS